MSRPCAETMPAVTVPPRPKGLPTAITQSPTRGVLSANFTNGKVSDDLIFSSAMSVRWSVPISSASYLLSLSKLTWILPPPSMTWLLVTTKPSAETTKPEPCACVGRGALWPPSAPLLRQVLEELVERMVVGQAGEHDRAATPFGLPFGACAIFGWPPPLVT